LQEQNTDKALYPSQTTRDIQINVTSYNRNPMSTCPNTVERVRHPKHEQFTKFSSAHEKTQVILEIKQ